MMNRNILKAAFALTLACGAGPADAQLVINELMQSNIDCIMDDLNEFPDSWVELYNAGSAYESLSDYKLGDKEKASKAYALPARQIAPGQYVIIYCDKEGSGMHASFRLESGKDGAVYLFKNDEVVDKVTGMKKQPAPNIAYGRKSDAADEWGYQKVPTPGAPNCGSLCADMLGSPVFSTHGMLLGNNFSLLLSLPEDAPQGTVIRYTLDGREPDASSPVYDGEIRIFSTTVVRAKLFCDGYLSPRSTTHSYIGHGREVTLPVVSVVTDSDYFYDSKLGIYVEGNHTPGTPNYEFDWRRPINIEYFEGKNSPALINQLCETRVKGGATRSAGMKSLAVYANKRFGEKRFYHEFFPDQTPGIDEFKSFEMRNAGNDFDYMYMRDAVIQQSVGLHADLDWQPSRPVILYINGEYKGIMNIRPRSNEDHIYSFYDGLEDIDMFENWNELKEGSWDNYNAFRQFYSASGHSFNEYSGLVDVGEFCNLMVMNTFFDNKDFPGNNIVMWRPIADGGRWRWVAKDTDFGMGLYGERADYPTLNWITTWGYDNHRNEWANYPDATLLFRRLLDVAEFKDMFIDRAAVYLGDFLSADSIISLVDKRYDELKFEYKYHRNRFNPWWPDYAQEIENARKWTRSRVPFFYRHLADFFKLASPVMLLMEGSGCPDAGYTINGVPLSGNVFDGKYFPGRTLTVGASATGNARVVAWDVTVVNGADVQTSRYNSDVFQFAMPQASKVVIVPVGATDPGAVDATFAAGDFAEEYFDLSGRPLGQLDSSALAPGIYIARRGNVARKIVVK